MLETEIRMEDFRIQKENVLKLAAESVGKLN